MNPLTPRWLLLWVAGVAGMPYKSCRHVGVIVDAHEAGTAAFVVRLVAGADFRGTEMIGRRELGVVNLDGRTISLVP